MKHFDLTISSSDLDFLLLALRSELKINERFSVRYPGDTDIAESADTFSRMLHVFETSGEEV